MVNEKGSPRANDPKRTNIAAVLSISVVSFFALIPVVNTISIPLEQSDTEIISLASVMGISPYTEYLKFSILLLVPLIVAIIALNTNQVIVNRYWEVISSVVAKAFSFLGNKKVLTALTLVLVCLWAISKSYIFLDFTLNDSFHEGEYLGFLPNFLALEKPFLGSFMIHGFGLDVLTSLIASRFANDANVIALTRFFRMTEGLITYLGCFWIIWELILFNKLNHVSRRKVFLLLCLLFTVLDGVLFEIRAYVAAGRDTLFILQLALIIRFFRTINFKEKQGRFRKLALLILIGITIPVSVLYVYDRAVYFFLIYLLGCALVLSFGRKITYTWLYGTGVGFTISAIAIVAVIGFDQVTEISTQMSYWARHAKYITFMPPLPLSLLLSMNREAIDFWRCFSFTVLTLIFSIFYLILDYKKNCGPEKFWNKHCLTIILLFASLMYLRISLDRSPDADHGALVSILLLMYLGLKTCKTQIETQATQVSLNPLLQRWIIALLTVVILVHPVLNPLLLPDKFLGLYRSLQTPDSVITRHDFLESYRALKPEIDQLPCFFTLSSEGFWYYLFKKQSCTKFSILAYAKSIGAQETIVREIDHTKPDIILFFTGSDLIGRTPTADAGSIVYQYFLNHYRPYTLVAGRWFWKRDTIDFTFAEDKSRTYGSIDTVDISKPETNEVSQKKVVDELSKADLRNGNRVWLTGTSLRFNQDDGINAVYVSFGEDNHLISVTWVDQQLKWRVRIPTMSLPNVSNGLLRVWGYDAMDHRLVQLGDDIKIDSSDSV